MTAPDSPTLAGTTPEARALLLRFGQAHQGCRVLLGPPWLLCGDYSPWYISCESAEAGMTYEGVFTPGTTFTHVCGDHLAQLRAEPRRIFSAVTLMPEGWLTMTVINLGAAELLGGVL